ncbi:MAG: DUF1404 family protein [Sulfolobaceae archaeon]
MVNLIEYVGGIRNNPLKLTFILILVFSFTNPWVEDLMFYKPYIFMTSHYSLIFSGILTGSWFFKGNKFLIILGIIPIILWHIPLPWFLSSINYFYRILSEITLWLGGLLVGISIKELKLVFKIVLLALWMLGDTGLSILFLVGNNSYLTPYYNLGDLQITGAVMFVLMNLFLIYILAIWFKKYFQI